MGEPKILILLRVVISYLKKNKNNIFLKTCQPIVIAIVHFPSGSKKSHGKCQMISFNDVYPVAPIRQDAQLWMSWWNSKAWNPVFSLDTLDFLGLLTLLPFNSFNHALNSSGTMGPAEIQVSIQKL